MLLAEQPNIMNRWQYTDAKKGFVSFINARYMKDDKQVGQNRFQPETDREPPMLGRRNRYTNTLALQLCMYLQKLPSKV
jgi:hypothetical protein